MRKNLVIALSVMLILVVVVGVVGIAGIRQVSNAWRHSYEVGTAISVKADDFEINFLNSRRREKDLVVFYKTEGFEKAKDAYITKGYDLYIEGMRKALKEIGVVELKQNDAEGLARVDRMEKLITTYASMTAELVKFIEGLSKSGAGIDIARQENELYEAMQASRETSHSIETEYNKMSEEGHRMASADINDAVTIERKTNMITGMLLLCVILLGIFIMIFIISMISKTTGTLFNAVSQITSASSEILAASQQQAAGAREQSAAVSETTSAARELSKSAEAVGDSIKRVSEVATHALAGMAKIKEAMAKTGDIITSLSEKSQKIGKITEVIDDVADQTNLLAVNAAIEAARAGEQGRGFTVVADEIRKLADSTAKSTKDITALIELIQHEMSNAIMSMETSVNSVDEESKLSQESAERSKEIAMSTTQQVAGSKQIAEAMSNIDEAMKQVAIGAQQSQVAVKQLTELGKELKVLTEKMK